MISQQLIDYIKQQTQLGKSREQISQELIAGGWQAQDVEQGFASLTSVMPASTSTELPKARQIFDEAWAIYKNRLKTLIAIGLIPLAGYALLLVLATAVSVMSKGFLKESTASIQPWIIAGAILFIIAIIPLIYIGLWATVAQLFAIKDQTEGIGWKEAFKRSRSKIWVFFGTSLLTGLAVLGGTILLIVPGIIFALWFSQSPYVVVEENLANASALKRSKYYVKGRLGQVFGKLFYIGIITFGLYIILVVILAVLDAVLGLKSEYTSWISNIFSLIWTPMATVYTYQLYKHLKATRP